MSRNAPFWFCSVAAWLAGFALLFAGNARADAFAMPATNIATTVYVAENPAAFVDYQVNESVVRAMFDRSLTNLTGQPTPAKAWLSLVSTQDVIGLKVFSKPGELSGTRPAVVAAIIQSLIAAGISSNNLIIWDKQIADLANANYFNLAGRFGVRVLGAAQVGYDPTNFYQPDTAILGTLVWGDLEFGQTGDGVGRRSFLTKIVSRQVTKIISIAPLLNDSYAGVNGHIYGLAFGSVDNTRRFEGDPDRLATAMPEIYALPLVGDRVVLNITDALIGQYEGSSYGLLQYSAILGQIWLSHDPVALDTLAIKELDRERRAINAPQFKPNLELYANAALLQLGINDPAKIKVVRLK